MFIPREAREYMLNLAIRHAKPAGPSSPYARVDDRGRQARPVPPEQHCALSRGVDFEQQQGLCGGDHARLYADGDRLSDRKTVGESDLRPGDEIDVGLEQAGGGPKKRRRDEGSSGGD
eukprot:5423558-Prymnesium_polylepis.2